jgi:hypothetical protein
MVGDHDNRRVNPLVVGGDEDEAVAPDREGAIGPL